MTDGVLLRETLFEPDLDRYCADASSCSAKVTQTHCPDDRCCTGCFGGLRRVKTRQIADRLRGVLEGLWWHLAGLLSSGSLHKDP